MTYNNWRSWGFRSRLSEIRCGPSSTQQQAENTQTQVSQEQLQISEQQQAQQAQQYQQYQQLTAPLVSQQTALASGDRGTALAAAMPTIAAYGQGSQKAKEQIMNTIPPGPARDTALANLATQSTVAPNLAVGQAITGAPATLANVGAGMGAMSVQDIAAALSGASGAATSAGAVAQEENAAQANKVGLVSGLAGAAGEAAGGIGGGLAMGSDIRLKTNIQTLYPILDKIMRARVVRFDYKTGAKDQIGVIAQELQKLIPECVGEGGDGMLYVNYAQLAAVSLAAVQELTARVKELEDRLKPKEVMLGSTTPEWMNCL